MATAIIMPDFGTTVEQVKLRSLAQGGRQSGERGETCSAKFGTDKATSELESIANGVLLKQVVPEGEDVQQGTVIAYVSEQAQRDRRLRRRSRPAWGGDWRIGRPIAAHWRSQWHTWRSQWHTWRSQWHR